jgi:hypothetical protein
MPLVLYCHGRDGTALTPAPASVGGNDATATFFNQIAEAGFIVASSDGYSAREWGNDAALALHLSAYRYVRDHSPINGVILVGASMGGLSKPEDAG